jgi:glutaredoxin
MNKKPHVTFYTKPGCHLCEEARRELRAAGIEDEYNYEEVNIELDAAAYERYQFEIPVVTVDGHKAFKYRLTAEEFKRRIRRGG